MKMPSASSKSSTMASQLPSIDGHDSLKVVVQMMEKKVRNLEKRKTKLDSYKTLADSGQVLNEDQKSAVAKIDVVENNLDFAREFHQTFTQLEFEHARQLKREQKRAKQVEKEQVQGEKLELVTRIVEVQSLLEGLSEEVRPDFLSGSNGAVEITEEDFTKLDGIYKLITPSQNEETTSLNEQVTASSLHLHNLVDERDKPVLETSTYKEVYSILKKVKDCGYFNKASEEEETEVEEETEDVEEGVEEEENAEEEENVEEGVTELQETEKVEEDVEGVEEEALDEEKEEEEPEETTESPEGPVTVEEESMVNGVDLPGDFSTTGQTEQTLDFMGESQVQPPVEIHFGNEGFPKSEVTEATSSSSSQSQMSASSPEFIPRSLQSQTSESETWGQADEDNNSGWQENNDADNGGWTEVATSDNQQHQQGRFGQGRGGGRGNNRGGRGFGGYGSSYGSRPRGSRGGGRGGFGQQNGGGSRDYGSRDYGQQKQDGFQRRGGGGPRGAPRGGRGGPRGAPRGGTRGDRGGFGNYQ